MKKPAKSKAGRPRIGLPLSITLTPEQRAWLESLVPPGGTLTSVVRYLIERARQSGFALDEYDRAFLGPGHEAWLAKQKKGGTR